MTKKLRPKPIRPAGARWARRLAKLEAEIRALAEQVRLLESRSYAANTRLDQVTAAVLAPVNPGATDARYQLASQLGGAHAGATMRELGR